MRPIFAAFLLTGCLFFGGCSSTWKITNPEACVGEQVVAPGEVMLTWWYAYMDLSAFGRHTTGTLFFVGPVGDEYEFKAEGRTTGFRKIQPSGPWEQTFRETDEFSISVTTIRLGGLTEEGQLRYWVEGGCSLEDNPWVEIRAMAEHDGYEGSVGCKLSYLQAIQLSTETQVHIFELCRFYPLWSCLAAQHGDGKAQHRMGAYYVHGTGGMTAEKAKAYLWYSLAASNGHPEAQSHRDVIVMTPAEIAEAERLIADWEPNPVECESTTAQAQN